jgi:hypothetical protein
MLDARAFRSLVAYRLGLIRHLFIHIPKNAGVSIHRAPELRWCMIRPDMWCLRDEQYRRGLVDSMSKVGFPRTGAAHARWRDVREDVRESLQAVAILRNPWSRTVSRYRFANTTAEARGQPKPFVSFEAFLEDRHENGIRPFYWHRAIRGWYPQVDYVTDETGKLRADMLRFEHLNVDTAAYFGLSQSVRPRNATVGSAQMRWQDYYTAQTIDIVADWYAADIEMFGFDFETSAQRNYWKNNE